LPADVAELAERFTFRGECVAYSDSCTLPVWSAHLADGRRVDYWAAPWQATRWGTGHMTAQDEHARIIGTPDECHEAARIMGERDGRHGLDNFAHALEPGYRKTYEAAYRRTFTPSPITPNPESVTR
jgi:hypothetical protein